MISAVAARKAAQAPQQQKVQQPPEPDLELNCTASPQSPKRKQPLQHKKLALKRPRRDEKQEPKSRHSSTPLSNIPKTQPDLIVVDSDDDQGEPINITSSEESDVEILSSPPLHLEKRTWSPSLPLNDLSSDDAALDTAGLIDLPVRLPRPVVATVGTTLSTFSSVVGQNTFFVSIDEIHKLSVGGPAKGTIVILGERDRLCLLGTCRLTLIRGFVTVNGVPLRPSLTTHSIFAPASSPLPVIECQPSNEINNAVVDSSQLPEYLRPFYSSRSTCMLLQECQSGVEGLGRVCQTFEGVYTPHDRPDGSVSSPFQIDGLYLVNKQTRDTVPFTLPTSWKTALTTVSTHPLSLPSSGQSDLVSLIKGPKKCGKSSFARVLLNTLLTRYKRVAFLECDIGQSEFTPSGLVSLNILTQPIFGPPYTHPSLPFRAHFIGAMTPRASPDGYLDAVRDLVDGWKLDIMFTGVVDVEDGDERVSDTVPLILNTMGWSKGLGADLMDKIEEMAQPGWIFDFKPDDFLDSSASEISSQRLTGEASNRYTLHPAPLSALSTNYSAADHRTLSILSYFHSIFPSSLKPTTQEPSFNQITVQSWDTILPLCSVLPYEIDVHTAFDQIILRGVGSEDVVAEEIGRVLNGAVIGFVRPDRPNNLSAVRDDRSRIPYDQGRPPPSPSESSCIGLGLIRAVSFSPPSQSNTSVPSATLQILTPIPPALLVEARILVKGEMELPIWGMLDFRDTEGGVAGVEKNRVPYLQWGRGSEDAIGTEKRRVRRNLMRKGQS